MTRIPARPVVWLLLASLLVVQVLWHGFPWFGGGWVSACWILPLVVIAVCVRRPDSVAGIVAAMVLLVYLIYGISEAMVAVPRWPGMLQAALSAAYILAVAISARRPRANR